MSEMILLPLFAYAIPDQVEVSAARRKFPATASSAGEARRFVLEAVGSDDPDLTSRLATLVSELATNAIRHARTRFTVLAAVDEQTIRVSVSDKSSVTPTRRHHDPMDPTGRGLVVVEALSDRWGFHPDGSGKAVWFEVDLR